MWNDPIVEETRRLRDDYCSKKNYNVHAIVEDLKRWEHQGFPMAENPKRGLHPTVLSSISLRQNNG